LPKLCISDGCENKITAKNYCHKHYMRLRRNGHVEPTRIDNAERVKDGLRLCTCCREYKPEDEFGKGKIKIYCKDCKKLKSIAEKYKLAPDEYKELIDAGCEICGSYKKLVVDHNHACCPGGATCGDCVRSVLCIKCNVWLGVYENKEWTDKADEYLRRHNDR
jgi:hypothetical protein